MILRLRSRALVLGALATLVLPDVVAAQAKKPAPTKKPAAPAATPAAPATTPAASALPAAREILDRYVQAIGGRDAIMKRNSVKATGTLEIPAMGLKADVLVLQAKPNRMTTTMTIPGMGEIRQGFDGTVAWAIDPNTGPRLLAGKEESQVRSQANFLSELHESADFSAMETVEKTDFEGRAAYKVRLVRTSGDESHSYFDVENGLLLGATQQIESQMGAVTMTRIVKDYKPVGGVLMATQNVQRANGQEMVITITSVETDVVDAAAFELPAPIKALVTSK